MARHTPPKNRSITAEFRDYTPQSAGTRFPTIHSEGKNSYTPGASAATDDLCEQLENSFIELSNRRWHLTVWGVHEKGADRWVQLSAATNGSVQRDVVLHVKADARPSEVISSIEAWLAGMFDSTQIIHVPNQTVSKSLHM